MIIAAGPAKVQFMRYRADDSVIGSFRSLWIGIASRLASRAAGGLSLDGLFRRAGPCD
jgi:hypothetical protein